MNTGKLQSCLVIGLFVFTPACDTTRKPQEAARDGSTSSPIALDPARATSAITGEVNFSGTLPRAALIKTDSDPTCTALHPEPLYAEDSLVSDGKLQNVFIWVKEGLENYSFQPPSEPVTITQSGCRYTPHVGGIMVNQKLRIVNGDATLHNIHCVAEKNKEFNIGQAVQGMTSERSFSSPEIMVRFKCDVHKWMSSYFGVVPHPYFGVTGKDGTYALQNLPRGEYVIGAWHEKFGTQTRKIKLGDRETKEVDFSFAPSL